MNPGSLLAASVLGLLGYLVVAGAQAAGVPAAELDEITVIGERDGLTGEAESATQGVVVSSQLEQRPVARPAELLEFVPGLIATQHSGEGKANQYFLRGFNLDHGTDFAISVEGQPVNMRSHAHGQGYADLNFLIPELVESLEYRKGPYYADVGDFSAAGSADFRYRSRLDRHLLDLEAGEDSYYRALIAGSPKIGDGDLVLGGSYTAYDGPWVLEQGIDKFNGIAKYTLGDEADGLTLTAMAYANEWNSPDQIPARAVENGQISRLGFIDPTVGGDSHRVSAAFDWHGIRGEDHWNVEGYAIDYELDLFSNFTYFLEDPENGDQFEQLDDRTTYGLEGHYHLPLALGQVAGDIELGLQIRHDDIDQVGLYRTRARERLSTIRDDAVSETSYGLFASSTQTWTDSFRSVLGLRADHFRFDVDSDLQANSSTENDAVVSPKLSLIFGPWNATDYFINIGKGFHSNDARGTTITVDPTDPLAPAETVDPLVDALGVDLGLRTAILPDTQIAFSVWGLELDSELVYVGDGGATEPSGESRRYGGELSVFYTPSDWLIVDGDYARTHARLTDMDERIPLAVEEVASLGFTIDSAHRWSGGARVRHFGSAPLIEDNSVRSDPTTVVNAKASYRINDVLSLTLAGFNLFDSSDNDVTYFYESRLAGEMQPVEDIHFHPVEPRTFRLTLTARL